MRYPNAELVGQAWMAAYSAIPAAGIAGTLPAVGKWMAADGGVAFLQMRALPGGTANIDLPERRSTVLQIDGYGTRTVRDTFRPVWSAAMDLLEEVREATRSQVYGRPLTMPLDDYLPARVFAGYLISEPVRVEKDPSGYARVTANLQIDWTV